MASKQPSERTRLLVVVTGDVASGKTALVRRYVNNYFPKPTVKKEDASMKKTKRHLGLEYALKLVTVATNDEGLEACASVILQIADDDVTTNAARRSVFGYHVSHACQKAQGALMVFDPTCSEFQQDFPAALQRLAQRKADFDAHVTFRSGDALPVVLVASKADAFVSASMDAGDQGTCLPPLDAGLLDAFCLEHGFVAWFATSAKTGAKVAQAFECLAQKVMSLQDRWTVDGKSYEDVFVEHCACG
ncbi:hypothetical protein M885DRAFT_551272 [Pelagophyceae sp. CCMP2097]|nr:hypothetical protein M885DRAFT_551272 [Pelagophyceae sp. CCMP2097]